MQPYWFPYLGYFQLIHAVDTFVFYDDVSFIKNGWINRNRILLDGNPHYITVPLRGASPYVAIDSVGVNMENPSWRRKLLNTAMNAYRRAPFRDAGMALLEGSLEAGTQGVAELARQSIIDTLAYLEISRKIIPTSRAYGNSELRAQDRVLDICQRENALTYVNAPGGRQLYDQQSFQRIGCELRVLEPRLPPYPQSAESFVPGLSILDLVMNCPPGEIRKMLSAGTFAPSGNA